LAATTPDWRFSPGDVDLTGALSLVLAWRRSNGKLEGAKVEFARDAVTEIRAAAAQTVTRLGDLTPRSYEPSIRIEAGEYLAVPDRIVERAAPPLPKKAAARGPSVEDGTRRQGALAAGGDRRSTVIADVPVARIETDPQVRNLLRRASGLPLLAAPDLGAVQYQFYAVVMGNDPDTRVAFVRKNNPTKSLDPGKRLLFAYGDRLTRVTEPLLSLDTTFDLVVTPDGIAVINQDQFERLFRDASALVERYPVWAESFTTLGLDAAQETALVAKCRTDSRVASRLREIYESGHLAAGKVTATQVLSRADKIGLGRDRFMSNGKLSFDGPDTSLLLRLLNEDIWTGDFSNRIYVAGSKARQQS
jgi:hypothetical protein